MPEKNNLIGMKTKAVPTKPKEVGIDTTQNLTYDLLDAAEISQVDMSTLESFTEVAQTREEVYTLIDTMSQDDTISAILETYAEDSVETNDAGQTIWCESSDENISKYVTYLLDSLNVNKNAYGWIFNLVKYGDLYLRLYRESDYGSDLLFGRQDENEKRSLNEDVNLHISGADDHYVHYVEAVANPGEMFELTKFGKTMGYIKAPASVQQNYDKTSSLNQYLTYKMQKNDVDVYDATDFVHACLQDNQSRTPEEVNIFLNDDDLKSNKVNSSYTVKKGQSILYNSFKIWREMTLLENSILLNRLTKSAIVRVLNVDVGDMPKEQVNNFMTRLKDKIEQKSALNVGSSMTEYTNPGPIENIIYVPKHGEQGSINAQTIGGDASVDPKSLVDLEYFQNKLFGGLRVPKQYFCLRGNTKLVLLNGEVITIKDLFDNKDKYLGKGIMSCASDGKLIPTTIKTIELTRDKASFIRVHLDNDKYLDVTPDHKLMLRDGTFIEAQNIKENDSLMPYYERIVHDRKQVLDNNDGKYKLQYRLVAENKFEDIPKGNQIHHIDNNKGNDDFDNLANLTLEEHYEAHKDMLHRRNKEIQSEHRANNERAHGNFGKFSVTDGFTNMWLDEDDSIPENFHKGQTCHYTEEVRQSMGESAKKRFTNQTPWNKGLTKETSDSVRAGIEKSVETKRKKGIYVRNESQVEKVKKWASEHLQEMREVQQKRFDKSQLKLERYLRCPVCGKIFTKKLNEKEYSQYLSKEKFICCCKECSKDFLKGGKLSRSYNLLKSNNFNFDNYEVARHSEGHRPDTYLLSNTLESIINNYNLQNYVTECNHKVVKVETLDVIEPAYDIEVASDAHTFATEAGVFVHNCQTGDSAGFDGGKSLSIISSRYGKSVKRIQNTFCQAVTDLVNLFLIDKGLTNYINKFTIKMQAPLTQEFVDRQEDLRNKVGVVNDIMSQIGNVVEDNITKTKILKILLSDTITDPEVITLLQNQIDALEESAEEKQSGTEETSEEDAQSEEPSRPSIMSSSEDIFNDAGLGPEATTEEPAEQGEETIEPASDSYLPTPAEVGIDATNNGTF